jgi:hypothetical protein
MPMPSTCSSKAPLRECPTCACPFYARLTGVAFYSRSDVYSDGQGGYTVPCTMTEVVYLQFGSVAFSIDPRDISKPKAVSHFLTYSQSRPYMLIPGLPFVSLATGRHQPAQGKVFELDHRFRNRRQGHLAHRRYVSKTFPFLWPRTTHCHGITLDPFLKNVYMVTDTGNNKIHLSGREGTRTTSRGA